MSFDLKLKNGDLTLGTNSDVGIVEKSDKLIQDILKITSTPLGANKFFPWYGSPLTNSSIGMSFDTVFTMSVMSNQLRRSIETLQSLQEEQVKDPMQAVTAQEQIAAIEDVKIERNSIDPRFFKIFLSVLNKAFRRVEPALNVSF